MLGNINFNSENNLNMHNHSCNCGRIVINNKESDKILKERLGLNSININNKYDPTRTLTLRNQFVSRMNGKFARFKQIIKRAITDYDVFGLKETPNVLELDVEEALSKISQRQFAFMRDPKKVDAFMIWINQLEEQGILEKYIRPGSIRGIEEAWTDTFILTAYQKGILRARQELRAQGVDIPTFEETGDVTSYIFNSPTHLNRIGLLATRTYNDLKGITNAMDQKISRVLAQGMMDGRGPLEIANLLVDEVDGIGLYRARLLARTEIIRAHAEANLTEYEQFGIEDVEVVVEWDTRGTLDVCPICQAFEGQLFTIESARGKIPAHPQCRCMWIPRLKEELSEGVKIR